MAPQSNDTEETFDLEIEITGISLFLWGEGRKKVDIVMPDATQDTPQPKHPNGDNAVPHAGYLRFDLRNLATGVIGLPTPGPADGPSYEVVHRFNREELQLGLPDAQTEILGELAVPDFTRFAPVREPIPGLLAAEPPEVVLMRTRLDGGEFSTVLDVVEWKILGDLRPDQQPTTAQYGGEIKWRREVGGPGLLLRIVRFDGQGTIEIPLVPLKENPGDRPSIRLKIANLCENPLEWPELARPRPPVSDVDFRCLYWLMQPHRNFDIRKYPLSVCPVPEPVRVPHPGEGDLQDCFPGQVS